MEFDEDDLENVSSSTPNRRNSMNGAASTTSNMSRKYVVEKLTSNNYRMWKTRMELILERTNLKEIVDGSSAMPVKARNEQQI
jgi:hypothetical protein